MTLTELKYLVALAREGHFGRAAKSCHVSQPTLSIAINKLENSLGVSLFERHTNGLSITDVGQTIVNQAQRVLEETEKLTHLAQSAGNQLDNPLKMGGIFTVAPYLFPHLIPALKKIAPDMPLEVEENFTGKLRKQLAQGTVDAIFVALPFKEPGIVVKPLYEEPFVVLLPKKHPLTQKTQLSDKDLKNDNVLLLGEGHCFRDQVLDSCPNCHQPGQLQQTVQGSSLETIRHMVASGMGITILPRTATQVKYYDKLLCIRPFKSKTPKRTIALAWRSSFPRPKAIEAIIQATKLAKLSDICAIA
jgi:LysR family hydrogen peroxide-inducible transcriptional activator